MKLDELAYQTAVQLGKDFAELRERVEKLEELLGKLLEAKEKEE